VCPAGKQLPKPVVVWHHAAVGKTDEKFLGFDKRKIRVGCGERRGNPLSIIPELEAARVYLDR